MRSAYVVVTGAFERDNFGDILFGELVSSALRDIPVIHASVISSDMRKYGGSSVFSLYDFAEANHDCPPVAIVHAGGEILTCSLANAVLMDLPRDLASIAAGLWPSIGTSLLEAVAGKERPLGYVWSKADLSAWAASPIRREALSAGGVDPIFDTWAESDVEVVEATLRELDRLEVRDSATRTAIDSRFGVKMETGVDIVFALRNFCATPISKAENEISNHLRHPFIIFQINSGMLKNSDAERIAEQLANTASHMNCHVIIQPAGLAAFHDDLDSLSDLADLTKAHGVSCSVECDRDVWRQVARIYKSELYIGSSLHGRIIATSGSVPAVSLSGRKAAANGSSWGADPSTFDVHPENMQIAALSALATTTEERQNLARRLEQRATASLNQLHERILHAIAGRELATASDLSTLSLAATLHEAERLRRRLVETAINSPTSAVNSLVNHLRILKSDLFLMSKRAVLDSESTISAEDSARDLKLALHAVLKRISDDD